MSKLCLFFLLISVSAFAEKKEETADDSKIDDALIQEGVETYKADIKAKDVASSITQSEQFQGCKEKFKDKDYGNDSEARSKDLEECFQEQLNGVDDEGVVNLGEAFNLKSFDRNASKSAKSIREYLQERLQEKLYGRTTNDEKLDDIKNRKFVDQKTFVELYKAQLGKNLLLEVSQYCLENFGIKDQPGAIFFVKKEQCTSTDGEEDECLEFKEAKKVASFKKENGKLKTEELTLENIVDLPNTSINFKSFSNLIEYKSCSTVSNCFQNNKAIGRTPKLLGILSKKEIELSTEPEAVGNRYKYCATQVINNMCEIYKCNNTYKQMTKVKNDITAKKFCLDSFNITDVGTNKNNELGQMACNLVTRLKEYRKILTITNQVIKDFDEFKSLERIAGLRDKTFTKGTFTKADSSLDKITTLSSKELVDNVDSFKGNEDEVKELQEKCFQDGKFLEKNEECSILKASVNQESFEKIEDEEIAKQAVVLNKLQQLKTKTDKEELEKILRETGLYEKYKDRLGSDAAMAELVDVIEDNYKAERKAVLNDLKARFERERQLTKTLSETDREDKVKTIAEEKLEDIAQHKKRVETLFQYSNIASSYLSLEDKDGKEVGSNSISRQIEIADLDKEDEIRQYISDTDESSGGGSSGSATVDINVIDSILGQGSEEN